MKATQELNRIQANRKKVVSSNAKKRQAVATKQKTADRVAKRKQERAIIREQKKQAKANRQKVWKETTYQRRTKTGKVVTVKSRRLVYA